LLRRLQKLPNKRKINIVIFRMGISVEFPDFCPSKNRPSILSKLENWNPARFYIFFFWISLLSFRI